MSEPAHEPAAQSNVESPATATADEDLLAALADEFTARLRRGEHPDVEEYVERHPALAERIRKVFQAVSLMEQSRTIDLAGATERVGAIIGRYKLLERIGEGGFGVVYMAEQQQPVRRKVALKVVKPGMDSRQVLARFEAERQALAIMDHPNIAKVFDGGMTDSGRPYFVMELVRGEPITEFCDRNHFSPRERLELFAQVCHAVQHAHQKGIIHRDIKPTNVLAAMHDTTPVVKVIDFGVAKALGQELTDKTLFTGFAQLIGTPLYMSPEQAGQSVLDIDTRSDIYSLGVLLYELLTGTTPFDKERFKQAAHDEICRIIREEEPPRPSTRLSESKDSLPSISAQRQTEPARLTKLVRGELDWIVMKALEKDRNRRYETANAFAADVLRYLNDEPVQACPPSAVYQMKKFVRRNKAAVTISALVLSLLVGLGSAIGWTMHDRTARLAKVAGQVELILSEVDQLEREQKWTEALLAARRAETAVASGEAEATTAQRVREQLKDLEFIDRLEQIRMQQATWLEGKFDDAGAEREYARAFRDYGVDVDELAVETSIEQLNARPALSMPLAAALQDWANVRVQTTNDRYSNPFSKQLIAIARGIDPEPLRDWLRSKWGKSVSADELRRVVQALDMHAHHPSTLRTFASRLAAKDPDAAVKLLRGVQSVHPGDFWTNYHLARSLGAQNDVQGAVRFYTAAVSIRPNAIAALNELGNALKDQEKLDEAVETYRKAIEIDPTFAYAYNNLGIALQDQKKLDEAVAAFRKAIELNPKDTAAYVNLGGVLGEQKKLDESVVAYRKAIELDAKSRDAYHGLSITLADQYKWDEAVVAARRTIAFDPKYAGAYVSLGLALKQQKKLDEGIIAYRKAVELDPKDARAYNNLGSALHQQKKLDEAVVAYRKAIELDAKAALPYYNLGEALKDQGNLGEANAAFQKVIELDPKDARDYNNLGRALHQQKKLDEAIVAYRKAIELDPTFAYGYYNLGNALKDQKKLDEAIVAYRKAIELDPKYALAYNNLGSALHQQKKLDEAVAAFRKAIEIDPTFAYAYNNLGIALQDQKKLDEAVAAFRKAIELNPKDTAAYVNLGGVLGEQKKLDESVVAYRKAIELDPKFADPHNGLAWLLATCSDARFRDPAQALALAEKAVEIDPQNVRYPNTVGVASYRTGDWKAAIAALENSMQLRQGGDSFDWFFLAMAHWQLGDNDESRQWYDRANEWMAKNAATNEELIRFRAEAAELLGVNETE